VTDLIEEFRNRIDSMLICASWVENAQDVLGLQGVSQVWTDKPSWYLWLKGAPGVHHLQLDDAFSGSGPQRGTTTGLFSIRFYPYPSQAVFSGFSREERLLLSSDLFDSTNTPRMECLGSIDPTLFTVGIMQLTIGPETDWSLFILETLDTLRTRPDPVMLQACPDRGCADNDAVRDISREVPGWDLAYQLFDRIISLNAYYGRAKPGRVTLTKTQGFEYLYESTAEVRCEPSDAIQLRTLMVLFPEAGDQSPAVADRSVDEELKRQSQEIVYDWRSACGCLSHGPSAVQSSGTLNERWWTIADAEYRSDKASTCGCH
jgi:hypothetical protein